MLIKKGRQYKPVCRVKVLCREAFIRGTKNYTSNGGPVEKRSNSRYIIARISMTRRRCVNRSFWVTIYLWLRSWIVRLGKSRVSGILLIIHSQCDIFVFSYFCSFIIAFLLGDLSLLQNILLFHYYIYIYSNEITIYFVIMTDLPIKTQ